MVNVGAYTYRAYESYNEANKNITESKNNSSTAESKQAGAENKGANKTDTVSLSREVEWARRREALGLNPTGKISKGDIEKIIDLDTERMKDQLASVAQRLGIDDKQEITLSLNGKGEIVINEKFTGKSALEEALNNDENFTDTFKRLSTNSEIIDYTKGLQARVRSNSLLSYMDSEADWGTIFQISSAYDSLKTGDDPLEFLTGISRKTNPFEWTYDPAEGKFES